MLENNLTQAIIGGAIEVHRCLGPGRLESVYEEALCHELHSRGMPLTRQQPIPICYKGIKLATDLRPDLLGANQVIVGLKAKEYIISIEKAQLLTYLRLCDFRLGLLMNFHTTAQKDGIYRVVNRLREPALSSDDVPDMHAPFASF